MLPALAEGERVVAGFQGASANLLREIVLGWWEMVGTKPIAGIPKLIMAEAHNFPEITRFYYDEVIVRGSALLKEVLQRGMERGMERGEFRSFDPEVMMHLIFAPLIMRVIWRHSIDKCCVCNVPAEQYLNEYLQLILRGLQTD